MQRQSTEEILREVLPPQEETAGVDFVKILDDFDPSTLTKEELRHFYLKEPVYVWVKKGSPAPPARELTADERIGMARENMDIARLDLTDALERYQKGKTRYEIVRKALIKAMRTKAIHYRLVQESR